MGLYEMPLSISLLGFGMRTMLPNFHMSGIMLLLRTVLNMLVRNTSPGGPMCLGAYCLVCQHPVCCYFSLCFIASWTWVVVCVVLYSSTVCVALLMDLFILCVACLTVFVGGGALLDRPCIVFLRRMYVLCLWSQFASRCSFLKFVCVCVCRKFSPYLGVWELDHRCLLSCDVLLSFHVPP